MHNVITCETLTVYIILDWMLLHHKSIEKFLMLVTTWLFQLCRFRQFELWRVEKEQLRQSITCLRLTVICLSILVCTSI